MRFLVIWIVMLFCAKVLFGQYDFSNYRHITSQDGLPSGYGTAITEDKYGFIWIGTMAGVARFDGVNVIVPQAKGDLGPPSSYVLSLQASGDSLWIGTTDGLFIYDLISELTTRFYFDSAAGEFLKTDPLHEYRCGIRDIYEDPSGDIWLAPDYNGFVRFDRRSNAFDRFKLTEDPGIPNVYPPIDRSSLREIIRDIEHESVFWAASMCGLIKLNVETGTTHRFMHTEGTEAQNFNMDRKMCLHQTSDGWVYTGGWNSGLAGFNIEQEEFVIPQIILPESEHDVQFTEHLYNIRSDGDDLLYLSMGRILCTFRPSTGEAKLLNRSILKGEREMAFSLDHVDSGGRLWSAHGNGVTMADPLEHQYRWYDLAELNPTEYEVLPRAIVEDFYPGYMSLVGQFTDGVYHIDLETGKKLKSLFPLEGPSDYFSSWGMDILDDNRLLITGTDSMYILDKRRNLVELSPHQVPARYNRLREVLIDKEGLPWVATGREGIFRMDASGSGNWQNYFAEGLEHGTRNVLIDQQGNVWFNSLYGHGVRHRAMDTTFMFSVRQDSSTTLYDGRNFCQCPNGDMWMVSKYDGIGRVDPDDPGRGIFGNIKPKRPSGRDFHVARIACDKNNDLWVIGSGRIGKLDQDTWTCDGVSLSYGVRDWSGMFQFLENGDLLLSSRDGFYTVDPTELRKNTILPKPYVYSIKTEKESKGSFRELFFGQPQRIRADEKLLTIEFSAVNHSMANGTKFQYMLEGVDEDWQDPPRSRSLTYSHLRGGDLTFRLRASNNEGVWNPKEYKLPIHIGTPWYRSVWFWTILGFLFMSVVYVVYRYRINQIEKENKLKTSFERKVANLEMSALRAQMNPHFIFNCLNSIESYIIRNDTKMASYYLNSFSRLVRLILQNSRSAYISLGDELETLELYLQLEQMRFKKTFAYSIEVSPGMEPDAYEIPPMLIQPFLENAIWHGLNHRQPGGKVTLAISDEGNVLRCVIEDNGVGREAAAKIRAAQKIKRTSMGMEITSQRMETINKIYDTKNEVTIEDLYDDSGHATGTRVTLNIPI